ncbi:hypothetical protein ABW19_dt0210540 [Dactylella cylindrospora]|nr:hypothetical protein ABW19_dt0210540 [Dactylella cylindrospora]
MPRCLKLTFYEFDGINSDRDLYLLAIKRDLKRQYKTLNHSIRKGEEYDVLEAKSRLEAYMRMILQVNSRLTYVRKGYWTIWTRGCICNYGLIPVWKMIHCCGLSDVPGQRCLPHKNIFTTLSFVSLFFFLFCRTACIYPPSLMSPSSLVFKNIISHPLLFAYIQSSKERMPRCQKATYTEVREAAHEITRWVGENLEATRVRQEQTMELDPHSESLTEMQVEIDDFLRQRLEFRKYLRTILRQRRLNRGTIYPLNVLLFLI